MKLMKRVWAALLLLAASGQLYADEGMWVLKELRSCLNFNRRFCYT